MTIALILTICAVAAERRRPEPSSRAATVTAGLQHLATAAPVYGAGADAIADDGDAEGVMDLYGNEVTDAVATYKLDAGGSLYEVHSPQTAMARLASPQG